MRKTLWITLALLAFLGVTGFANRTHRLTIINKSGLPIGVRLVQQVLSGEIAQQYYLNVPRGDKDTPVNRDYDVLPGTYALSVYSIEIYDPVYGYQCPGTVNNTLKIDHNQRLLIFECGQKPPNRGEATMFKLYNWPRKRGR